MRQELPHGVSRMRFAIVLEQANSLWQHASCLFPHWSYHFFEWFSPPEPFQITSSRLRVCRAPKTLWRSFSDSTCVVLSARVWNHLVDCLRYPRVSGTVSWNKGKEIRGNIEESISNINLWSLPTAFLIVSHKENQTTLQCLQSVKKLFLTTCSVSSRNNLPDTMLIKLIMDISSRLHFMRNNND